MTIELLSEDSYPSAALEDYDAFVSRQAAGIFTYSARYRSFLAELLGCRQHYLLDRREGRLRGILPLMILDTDHGQVINSLPYFGSHGGVLAEDVESNSALTAAYNELACGKGVLTSTIVGNPFFQPEFARPEGSQAANIVHNFIDHRIGQFTPLYAPVAGVQDNGLEYDVWADIIGRMEGDDKRRLKEAIRDTKRAERQGVTVAIENGQLDWLRQAHQANIAAKGGLAKEDRFFALIPQHFQPGRDYRLYVARREGSILAAVLLFYFNRTVEYFTPAVDHDYRSVPALPLIIVRAVSEAANQGYTWWHWGGTWLSQAGVYEFKRQWGANERRYHYYTQLNDASLLGWSRSDILNTFPHFFVIPFSALHSTPLAAG